MRDNAPRSRCVPCTTIHHGKMDQAEVEGEAQLLREWAGFAPDQRASAEELSKALGLVVVPTPSALIWGEGALLGDQIVVRSGLDARRAEFVIAHEIAEWHLLGIGYREADVEDVANRIGAALLAPQALVQCAPRAPHWATLAQALDTTESFAALRWGEVFSVPLVLVTPHTIRVRGPEWIWPHETSLRRLAFRYGERLGDDHSRVVWLAPTDSAEQATP